MDRKTIIDNIKQYIEENNCTDEELSEFLANLKMDVYENIYKDKLGLYVLKKTGAVEPFDKEKIFNSLGSASDNIGVTLPASDIKIIRRDVMKNIENLDRNLVSTTELRYFIAKSLQKNKYYKLVEEYTV